ncbi:MAG: hypothetical protein M3356_04080 [Actinomycetota bacterium]|nr:hypothetical protein [Actinomycetota bacterium]
MRYLVSCAAVLGALVLPMPAHAAGSGAKLLWATVNLCDTAAAPDTVGVRASMPGNGTRQRLYMRFEAQWFDERRHRFVASGSSSRWIHVGSARFRSTQSGFTFGFGPPPAGTEFKLRGLVSFEWRGRRDGRQVVVRRESRVTRGGIAGVEGGDPPGTSKATCVIR